MNISNLKLVNSTRIYKRKEMKHLIDLIHIFTLKFAKEFSGKFAKTLSILFINCFS